MFDLSFSFKYVFFCMRRENGKGPNCISVLLYCHMYVITLNDIVKPLSCTDILSLGDKMRWTSPLKNNLFVD